LGNIVTPQKIIMVTANKIKIALADDNDEMLYLIKEILEPEFEVVAAARDGPELLKAVEDLKPDVIIVDINMPEMSGYEVARKIVDKDIEARIILLTVHKDRGLVEIGFSVGAMGFVLKFTAINDLVPAVNEVFQGNRYISPAI
jgi:DNA-binding NarL/FixJ family response regulator